jgi:hypothetical protein
MSRVQKTRSDSHPASGYRQANLWYEQPQISRDERADTAKIVAPDCVRESHRVNESRPAQSTVAACKHKLGVRQLRGRRVDRFGMVFT